MPQLVQAERFGEDVGHLSINQNISIGVPLQQREHNTLAHEAVMHFYALCPSVDVSRSTNEV